MEKNDERYIRYKASLSAFTGSAMVREELAEAVLEELENSHTGTFYGDVRMNGMAIIEKSQY